MTASARKEDSDVKKRKYDRKEIVLEVHRTYQKQQDNCGDKNSLQAKDVKSFLFQCADNPRKRADDILTTYASSPTSAVSNLGGGSRERKVYTTFS
ncbi:MAG: hypothetical protein WC749_04715 [Dehalococcoidia bacterium]